MTEAVLTDDADGVLVITINRPEARNAVNGEVARGIAAALDALDGRDDLNVGVITGAGGTFCAGMDLKAFLTGERPAIPGRGFGGLTEAPPAKPLIAAVEGYALAGAVRSRCPVTWWWRPTPRSSASPRSSAAWWPRPAGCCGCPGGSRTRSPWSSP